MNWKRALTLIALQLMIVSSLGAKLRYDRATRPRLWVQTIGYDPNLPVRGRYAAMRLVVYAPWLKPDQNRPWVGERARLEVCGDKLCAIRDSAGGVFLQTLPQIWPGMNAEAMDRVRSHYTVVLAESVDFYIPEHAQDPTWRRDGTQLWAEVTIPKTGPPRPIRLGRKTGDGPIVPFEIH